MLIPKGYYRGRALPATYDMGADKDNNPEVGLSYEFTSGEYAGQRLTWKGGFGTEAVTTNGKSKNMITFDTLLASGMTNDDVSAPEGLGSTEVDLVVDHYTFTVQETGEEKTVAQIRWVNAPSGPKFKNKLDPVKRKAFASQLKASMIAHRRANGAPSPAASTPRNGAPSTGRDDVPPIGDEDIPF